MASNDLEKKLEIAYRQVFYTLLMEEISECKKIEFKSLSEKNRNDIGRKANDRSITLAKGFVSEMKTNGYLERKPSDDDLKALFTQYLNRVNRE